MIHKLKPLTMAETKEIVSNIKSEEETQRIKDVNSYLKKFLKLTPKKAFELKDELSKLEIMSLKEENIVKIVDFLPQDAEEIRKVCLGCSFSEEEINKILEIVKKFV